MIKMRTQKKIVYGELFTDFGRFQMLEKFPTKNMVPWYMKDAMVFSFFVVDSDNFGKTILVAGNSWMINPLTEPAEKDVHFLVDDEHTEGV